MEDFVSIELAKKLKEKGFKEKCLAYYNGDDIEYNFESPMFNNEMYISHNSYDNLWHRDYIDTPTIAEALKWLRDEKRIVVEINCNYTDYFPTIRIIDIHKTDYVSGCDIYDTYESAALAGIEYVLDDLL